MNPGLFVRHCCPLSALSLLALAPQPGAAATLTWTNTLGGNWNVAANGQPNAVPGAADTANLTTPGTYTVMLNVNATVAVLNLGAASGKQTAAIAMTTLNSTAATVGRNGVIEMASGSLTGQLTVRSGGLLSFVTSAVKGIPSLSIFNEGTVMHSGGALFHGGTPATTVTNQGLWDIQGNTSVSWGAGGPTGRWVNSGVLLKSSGGGLAQISSFELTNTASGLIECSSGTLRLPGGYVNTTGTLRLDFGAITAIPGIEFRGGLLEGTGGFGGSTFLGGTISPGLNGPGSITFYSGLSLGEGVVVAIDAMGTTPRNGHDQLEVNGPVGITNSVLQFTAPGAIPIGTKLIVITNDSNDAIVGTFAGRPEDALFDTNLQLFRTRYAQGSGNDMAIVRDDGGVRLTGIKLNPAGQFEFRGLGTNGVVYSLYASPVVPNSTANWQLIGTSTADVSGNFLFTDTNAFQFPKRFYYSIGP